jgi:transcriptional regulator with XRE-family HTH domain
MSLISENLKFLRKRLGYTQEQMAERAGIKRSLLGAYEEGRADPRIVNLLRFSEIFDVSVDELISRELSSQSHIPSAVSRKLQVLSITVDHQNRENIELVPQKASAGYLNGFADLEYIGELPRFQLPMLPQSATYRAFEISGDSMLPLRGGSVVIGRYTERVDDLKNGDTYVVVGQSEGVVYKRVYKYADDDSKVCLVSDNTKYPPYDVAVSEILELWEAKAYISLDFPNPSEEDLSLKKLADIVLDLQSEVIKLKQK